MNKNVVFGLVAVALCIAAVVALRGDEAPEPAPAVKAAAAAPAKTAATLPRTVPRGTTAPGKAPEKASGKRPPPNIAVNPDDEIAEGTVAVAKEDFEDALAALDEVDPNASPDDVAAAIREATRALDRFEAEADADNSQHKRLHAEAVRQLQTRLKKIEGKEGRPSPD